MNLLQIIHTFRWTYKYEGREEAVKWVNGIGLDKSVITAIVAMYDRRLDNAQSK